MKAYIYCTKRGERLTDAYGNVLNGTVCATADVPWVSEWEVLDWEDDDGCEENGRPIIRTGTDFMRNYGWCYKSDGAMRDRFLKMACLSERELYGYVGYPKNIDDYKVFYGWHLRDVHPTLAYVVLSVRRPPQSWCYVENMAGEKCLLLSVHPKWVRLILSGEKTVEIRKTAPKPIITMDVIPGLEMKLP